MLQQYHHIKSVSSRPTNTRRDLQCIRSFPFEKVQFFGKCFSQKALIPLTVSFKLS